MNLGLLLRGASGMCRVGRERVDDVVEAHEEPRGARARDVGRKERVRRPGPVGVLVVAAAALDVGEADLGVRGHERLPVNRALAGAHIDSSEIGYPSTIPRTAAFAYLGRVRGTAGVEESSP